MRSLSALVLLALPLSAGFPPPPAKTGAPGDGRCSECHSASVTNPTRVIVDFTRLAYTPGVPQTIGVHVLSNNTAPYTGFQITARLGSNELQQAGSFVSRLDTIGVQTLNGIQYANHTGRGGSQIYILEWTPPATNVGPVRFYVSAVAGDANGVPDGNVATASYTLQPATRDLPPGIRTETFAVPGSNFNTYPAAISNSGVIVGPLFTSPSNRAESGFIRAADGTFSTFTLPGAAEVFPTGVNTAGQIVGYYAPLTGGNFRAFLRNPDGSVTFPTFPGTDAVQPMAINDFGQVVGNFGSLAITFPFANPSAYTFFDVAPGNATAYGVTNAGRIIGRFNNSLYVRSAAGDVMGASVQEGPALGAALSDSNQVTMRFATTGAVVAENGRRWPSNLNVIPYGQNEAGVVVGKASAGTNAISVYTPCTGFVGETGFIVPAAGGTVATNRVAETGCQLFVENSAPWVTVTQTGTGYNLQVAVNNSTSERTANVRIGGTVVSIRQQATACTTAFGASASTFGATGGGGLGVVTAPAGCQWVVTSNQPWVSLSQASGAGNGGFAYGVAANPGTQQRTATLTLGTQTVAILQAGAAACSYSISPSAVSLAGTGATGTINIQTGAGCAVSNVSPASWITLSGGPASGPGSVTYTVAANPLAAARTAEISIAGLPVTVTQAGNAALESYRYVPITPCRLVDTRLTNELLVAGGSRNYTLPNLNCGIPASARAVAINLTAVPLGPLAFLTIHPSDQPRPLVSTLNSFNGRVVANLAIVPTSAAGEVTLFAPAPTHVVMDAMGYFVPRTVASALQFYPVAPCRVADTRVGGATKLNNNSRNFPVRTVNCGIPPSASAYALNITAVPTGALAYITAWPAGQAQPVASTLNSFDGQVVPNAAIIPAGTNGEVSLFASNETDVVIDVNGYFAPPSAGGLDFYPLAPCRVADTRTTFGTLAPGGTAAFLTAGCGTPATAKAYSLNFTSVPQGYLGFVTAYAGGTTRPLASTLNSWNGQIVANAGLIPAGLDLSVEAYALNATDLILDINGYFAP